MWPGASYRDNLYLVAHDLSGAEMGFVHSPGLFAAPDESV